MKKAIITTVLILGIISAALFGLIYFKGSQKNDTPKDNSTKPAVTKSDDDLYLPSDNSDKRTSDEILHSMDDVDVKMKDSYPKNYEDKYTGDYNIIDNSDYDSQSDDSYPVTDDYDYEQYDMDATEDDFSDNENTTSENTSADSEAAYFNLNDNSENSEGRYEVSREKYEECGYDSDYYIVTYSDGTREIVEGDNQ